MRYLFVCALVLLLGCCGLTTGCGGAEEPSDDDDATEAIPTPTPGPTPDSSIPLSEADGESFGSGTLSISGSVFLPEDTAADAWFQFDFRLEGSGKFVGKTGYTTHAKQVDYYLYNLPGGTYTVGLVLDQDNDDDLDKYDDGNYVGYYDGTLESPIFSSFDATPIFLESTSISGLDFGIGAPE